ncbi:MAG: hypothetical protein WDN04_06770 [Rhodospirillales bacterium]
MVRAVAGVQRPGGDARAAAAARGKGEGQQQRQGVADGAHGGGRCARLKRYIKKNRQGVARMPDWRGFGGGARCRLGLVGDILGAGRA